MKVITVFKFGEEKHNWLESVTIPAKISHKNIKIVMDVTDSELPLFLSKKKMKMTKAKIDFDHDIINIFGQGTNMVATSIFHWLPRLSRVNFA